MRSQSEEDGKRSCSRAIITALCDFKNTLVAYPALWIGFACICAWPWSCTSATLVYSDAITIGSPLWIGSNFTYLIIGVIGFAIAVCPIHLHRRSLIYSIPLIAACCYSAASSIFITLCKLPPNQLLGNHTATTLLWPLLAGMGQIILFVNWVNAFGKLGSRKTVALVVLGSLFGTSILYLLNFVPQTVRELAPLSIGLGASTCAFFANRILEDPLNGKGHSGMPRSTGVATECVRRTERRPPWKLLITTATAGFSFGIFQSISFSGGFGPGAWYDFGVMGFFLAALLFALCAMPLRMNFNHLIYRVSFVLMSLGALLCIIAPENAAWGYEVFCVGYRFFDILIWCLCAYLVHHRATPSTWLGGLCMGTLLLGRFIGFECFGLWDAQFGEKPLSVLLALALFLLMFSALYLVSQTNLREAWGMAQPGEADNEDTLVSYCCDQIAQTYALSAREKDVLTQLAYGKSRLEVSQALVLSEETIKTHIHHVYQKLNIHSRKELDQLLTSFKRDARSGQATFDA